MNNQFQLCIHKFTTKYIWSQIQDLSTVAQLSALSRQHSPFSTAGVADTRGQEYRVVTSNAQIRPIKANESRDGAKGALSPPEKPNLMPDQLASYTRV